MKIEKLLSDTRFAALKEFATEYETDCRFIFIYKGSSLESLMAKGEKINGKEIIFIDKEEEVLRYVEQTAVIFEVEIDTFKSDTLIVKISHNLFVKIDNSHISNGLKAKLSQAEVDHLEETVRHARQLDPVNLDKTILSLQQNAWTYVTFKITDSATKFNIMGIETRRI